MTRLENPYADDGIWLRGNLHTHSTNSDGLRTPERVIEIFNGATTNSWGSATAIDRWDQLLSTGRRVWGYANDDVHRPWEVGRGWNHVQVDEDRPPKISDALVNGRFYASTGVRVDSIEVSRGEIAVKTDDAEEIRFITDYGVVQKTVEGSIGRFRVPEQLVHKDVHSYVRVECHGSGTDRAWLQPMFLDA